MSIGSLKLSFFQRRRNLTGHNFFVVSNFWSSYYYDSFDEAHEYAINIRADILANSKKNEDENSWYSYYDKGYAIYGWDKNKWYMIEKWIY